MIFLDEQKNKDKIGIYLIRNKINEKVYIGQTSDRFIERYWHHKWKLNNQTHDNIYLQNAWNKYGEENFDFEVIYELKFGDNIDNIEREYISKYPKNKKYNIQIGGQDYTMKNKKMSKHTKELIGQKNKINGIGRKASKETKEKMSKKRLGKTNWERCLISYEQAYEIKKRILNNEKLKSISKEMNIDYKIINGIYSLNTYKSVKVDGWDEFVKNKVSSRKVITKEMINEMIELSKIMSDTQIANKIGVCRSTVTKYLSK